MSPEEWLASQTQAAPAAPAAPVAAPGMSGARVTPTEQAARNQESLPIFTQELAKAEAQVAAGNPRAAQDVAAIKREMTRQGLPIPAASAPAAPAPSAAPAAASAPVSPEAWLASQTPAAPPAPSTTVTGLAGAATRGLALPAAGALAGAAMGAPFAGIGAVPGALAGAGAATLAQVVGDPIVSAINNLFNTQYTLPTDAMTDLLTRIGVPQAKSQAEKIVQATAAGASMAGGTVAAGRAIQSAAGQAAPVTREVGRMLGTQPGLQALSGAAGGGAGQVAQEMGAGTLGQIAAAVAGGMTPVGVKGVIQATRRAPAPAAPRVEPTFETQVPTAAPPVPPAAPPVAGARQLPSDIEAARQAGITLMTSDVVPPRTFASKWLQTIGERIPGAGTGGVRQAQQTERIEAVRNVLREFGADDAARAADDVMKDLATKRGADLKKYTGLKTEVIERLGETGTVPMTKTVQAIDDQIAKLEGLKTQEVAPIIERLTDWKAALQDQNLINVETLRKQIGESFKAPELASVRGIGEKALSSIYKPLKQDMEAFITQVGERRDVTKYKVANKRLSDLAGELDMSTLKSVLRRGDETPEVIANMLFSKKPSEVRQLYASLTPAGRESARAAILARAAEKATADVAEGTVVSPDKFANEVKRLGTSVGVFFNGDDLKQIEGLTRVLNITKRASEAAAAPPTGVQAAIPVSAAALSSFFGGGLLGFLATLGAAGSVGVAARIYESAPIRNLLIKIPQTVTGSKEEAALLKRLTSVIQTGIQTGRQFDQENQ